MEILLPALCGVMTLLTLILLLCLMSLRHSIRETAEETGFIVRPTGCFLLLHEFYEDWKYTSYYFRCAITGQTDRAPTDAEIERGATPEWIGLDEATEIFSHHQDYAESDEERRGIYLREYLALSDDSLQKES